MAHKEAQAHPILKLLVALLQSVALGLVAVFVIAYGHSTHPVLLALGCIALGVPALLSIHAAWLRFLWAKKLYAAQRLAATKPSDVEAHYELGILAATIGRYHEAKKSFDTALRIHPKHAPSLVGHGHIAAQLNDTDRAISYFEEAASQDSKLFSAPFGLGRVHQIREQYARAIKAFEKALDIEPEDGATLAELARCYAILGDESVAESFQARAIAAGYKDEQLDQVIKHLTNSDSKNNKHH